MSKITYLFGAGASWESIPVVGELEKAFQVVKNWNAEILQNLPKNPPYSNEDRVLINSSKTFDALLQTVCFNTPIYKTVDTFAKKLSICDQKGDLHNIKAALSLFFTLWQESSVKEVALDFTINRRKFNDIDSRYFGLLTNYLIREENKVKFDPNVRFISWNYDTQIERALAFILDKSVSDISSSFKIHPFSLESDPCIVHLNGIAGYYKTERSYGDLFREKLPLGNRKPVDVLKGLLFFIDSVSHMSINVDDHFTFAWENEKINSAVNQAEKILADTDTLVVVGYSFPNFNNEIDKRLLSAFNNDSERKNRKLYYQDPKGNKTLLTKRFGIPEKIIEIDSTNMDQFILPLERIS